MGTTLVLGLGVIAVVLLFAFDSQASVTPVAVEQDGTIVTEPASPQYLSATDIAAYAYNAGFDGDDLIIAVAVALAESSGNTRAYNPERQANTPEGMGSYGLWQIYEKVHPEYQSVDLTNPQNNAIAAYAIYQNAGYTFRPWSTFNNGAYLSKMTTATSSVNV